MARFTVHTLTKKVVNAIRTYFAKFWSKLIGNKGDHEQQLGGRSNSKLRDKSSGLNRIKPMKKIRRLSNHVHAKYFKTDKQVQRVIKNDYFQKTKIHCITCFYKSIF